MGDIAKRFAQPAATSATNVDSIADRFAQPATAAPAANLEPGFRAVEMFEHPAQVSMRPNPPTWEDRILGSLGIGRMAEKNYTANNPAAEEDWRSRGVVNLDAAMTPAEQERHPTVSGVGHALSNLSSPQNIFSTAAGISLGKSIGLLHETAPLAVKAGEMALAKALGIAGVVSGTQGAIEAPDTKSRAENITNAVLGGALVTLPTSKLGEEPSRQEGRAPAIKSESRAAIAEAPTATKEQLAQTLRNQNAELNRRLATGNGTPNERIAARNHINQNNMMIAETEATSNKPQPNHAPVETPTASVPSGGPIAATAASGPLVQEALRRRALQEQALSSNAIPKDIGATPVPSAVAGATNLKTKPAEVIGATLTSSAKAVAPKVQPIESTEFPADVARLLKRSNAHFDQQANPKLSVEQQSGHARAFARTAEQAKIIFEEHAKNMTKEARTKLAGNLGQQATDFATRASQLRQLARQTREHSGTERSIMERMATTGQYEKRLPVTVGGEQLSIEERPLPTETEKSVWRKLMGVRTKEVPTTGRTAGMPGATELLKQAKTAVADGVREAISRGLTGDEAIEFAYKHADVSPEDIEQLEEIAGRPAVKEKYAGKAETPADMGPLTTANVKLIQNLYGLKSNLKRLPTPEEMDVKAAQLERYGKQAAHFSRRLQFRNSQEGRIGIPVAPEYQPKGPFDLSPGRVQNYITEHPSENDAKYEEKWLTPKGESIAAPIAHTETLRDIIGMRRSETYPTSDPRFGTDLTPNMAMMQQALDEGWVRKHGIGNYQMGSRTLENVRNIENDIVADVMNGHKLKDGITIDTRDANGRPRFYEMTPEDFERADYNLDSILNRLDRRSQYADYRAGIPTSSGKPVSPELEDANKRVAANTELLEKLVDPTNIRSTDDVSKVLNDVGDALTKNPDLRMRGPIADEQTKMLAANIGLTPEDLLASRSHTAFNDAQVVAANTLLNNSVKAVQQVALEAGAGTKSLDDFLSEMAHHVELEDVIRNKVGAEAGRALRARQIGKLPTVASADLSKAGASRAEVLGAAAFDVLKKLPQDMKKQAANEFIKLPQGDTRAAAKFIRDYARFANDTSLWNRVKNGAFEIYLNSLLSGNPEAKKFASDSSMVLLKPLQTIASTTITGNPDFQLALQQAHAAFSALPEAVHAAAESWITELGSGSEFEPRTFAVPGKLGRVVRVPTRALAAVNDFFNAIQTEMHMRTLATDAARQAGLSGQELVSKVNELVATRPYRMWRESVMEGRRQTFNEPIEGKLGTIIRTARALPGGKWLAPIFKVPYNIGKMGLDFTPFVGIVRALMHGDDIKLRNNIIARNIIGTAAMTWAFNAARKGQLSGRGPSNPTVRRQLEDAGWKPYSIKIGNTWHSYRYLEPIATPLMIAGTINDTAQYDHAQTPSALIIQALANVGSGEMDLIPFAHTLSAISAMTDGGPSAAAKISKFVDTELGTLIPTAVADLAHEVDRTYRKTGSLVSTLESRIPEVSKRLPAYKDELGRPSQREPNELGGFNPYPWSTERPEDMAMFRAEEAIRREEAKARYEQKKLEEKQQ